MTVPIEQYDKLVEISNVLLITLIAFVILGFCVVWFFVIQLRQNRKRFDKIGDAAGRISELMDQTTSGNISHKRENIKSLVNVIKRNLN